MAGWPFDELALNPKCVVFSGSVVAAYMYLPCRYDRNWLVTASALGVGSYFALAWYDHMYSCNNKMRPGLFASLPVVGPLYTALKP